MTADEGRSPGGNDTGDQTASGPDEMPVWKIQVDYILRNFPDAAIYPVQPVAGVAGLETVEFIYRPLFLLTRDRDLLDVLSVLSQARRPVTGEPAAGARDAGEPAAGDAAGDAAVRPGIEVRDVTHPIPGLALIELAGSGEPPAWQAALLFDALDAIERQLGPGIAAPDHMLSVTPATDCPATEPDKVPGDAAPLPGVSRSRCNGRGTRVAVVDTGLVHDTVQRYPWLDGVTGETDHQVEQGTIVRYGGHGTFIASIIRAMAPRAEVRVARGFEKPGAIWESQIVKTLLSVLDWAPDVISLSAGTHTWKHRGLLSFHVFVDGPLRECPATVLVAAAGNDGQDWKFSPAEMDAVVGVGALGPPGDALAWFSDYGDWVKVFAPGQDLVHAFARGRYDYQERRHGEHADFDGMARWSGTSFSTPVVSGLIAARMSGTGESAREAADSLLQLARAQALPGIGPVLRPGQACLSVCDPPRPCTCHPPSC